MTAHLDGYAKNRRKGRDVTRVVTELPSELVQEVDNWGISEGMKSRAEAVRKLLRRALEQKSAAQK